jgi:hypothetical protein
VRSSSSSSPAPPGSGRTSSLGAKLSGLGAEVVLGAWALGPLGRGLALQEAVEEVVVVDVQTVADLSAAEARPAEGDRLVEQTLEVGVLALGMCHGHTVWVEWGVPGSNAVRFSSSRDTGWFRFCSHGRCGVGQYEKLAGKAGALERRLGV